MLGEVVLARYRAEDGARHLVRLGCERREPAGYLEVDQVVCEQRPLHDPGRTQVAVPTLDRMVLDVPVPAEQLHAVGADAHAVARAQRTRERGLAPKLFAWSARLAAHQVARRMPSSSIAMSATAKATAWRFAIDSPNASRSFTYGMT